MHSVTAERHAQAALAEKERRLGPDHPELAVTPASLGTIRRRRGEAARAVKLHRPAVEVLAAAVEPEHPLLAIAMTAEPPAIRRIERGMAPIDARPTSAIYVQDDRRSQLIALLDSWEGYLPSTATRSGRG